CPSGGSVNAWQLCVASHATPSTGILSATRSVDANGNPHRFRSRRRGVRRKPFEQSF
ncbi:MAG: hypothetical protein AVDCRST_MAG43-1166, partial [uncultured Thermomicrobiales bacterium]